MTTETLCNKLLPDPIQQLAEQRFVQLQQSHSESLALLTPTQLNELKCILGLSDFIANQLQRFPQWIVAIADELDETDVGAFYKQMLNRKLAQAQSETDAKRILRQFRHRHLITIAWRDFMGHGSVSQSLSDLSLLAEALIIGARDWQYQQLCQQYGTPLSESGEPQQLLILGMGKLGGGELNFSSDIDLIFTYPEAGQTQGGRKELDNQQFFTRMGQKLIALLDQVTVDGFVYRVDMRLRPNGDSGPLVCSFNALEHYYQDQGREWERYAMIKARVLGPLCKEKTELTSLLRPFIYRRYIDFTAIDSLRKMKKTIAQEVRRRQLSNNIKLGSGGIREVEFIVQNFQLIHGGRQVELRKQNIFKSLDALFHHGMLAFNEHSELKEAYLFLRQLENLLQAIDDKQTQTLPDNDLDWQRLCFALKIPTPEQLKAKINQVMTCIHQQFQSSVGGDQDNDNQPCWAEDIWQEDDIEQGNALLQAQQVNDPDWFSAINKWRSTTSKRPIGPKGQDALDQLMPRIIAEISKLNSPCTVFTAVSQVLDQILCRTTYLELLCENAGARNQLFRLCKASPWIATQLASYPMLLDELIDPRHLYNPTNLDDYRSELHLHCLRIPEEDIESQMEALREYKLTQQLKIAAADITGVLPLTEVSDHLTCLAEAIIEQVCNYAWQQVTARHGKPAHLSLGKRGFAVIGYGKLGGRELGYGSDLDLVFLIRATNASHTDGVKPIESSRFYAKLAQKMISLLSTRTASGELYEVDMRLRPSGASGLLVSEINSFAQYQLQAKTWEKQALIRARFISGETEMEGDFVTLRNNVLTQRTDLVSLSNDVHQMRMKMREHLLSTKSDTFDLKHSSGGMVDIEFIVQYLVLAFAHQHPSITSCTDNIRILQLVAKLNLLPATATQQLIANYQQLRDASHRQALSEKGKQITLTQEIQSSIAFTQQLYQELLLPNSD
ncbi:MAG: bifunctional [glutamate--ammonia ligase]-adenylyl-L-tyrosine phosphorylase/[glutamate--ammonia-ligase] adenylyltransferase [Parashewanella sp.]